MHNVFIIKLLCLYKAVCEMEGQLEVELKGRNKSVKQISLTFESKSSLISLRKKESIYKNYKREHRRLKRCYAIIILIYQRLRMSRRGSVWIYNL